MDDALKETLTEVSPERALTHAELLASLGPRLNVYAREAAQYIEDQLNRFGLAVELQRFSVWTSDPGKASLRLLVPEERDIPCRGYAHVDSTPEGGLTAELVYVGGGREEDYDGLDVGGKIVLAELGSGPARPEKARIALAQGAVGLIVIDWGPPEQETTSNGALKGVWGIPTRLTLPLAPRLPGVGVPRAAGELLRQLIQQGRVVVNLKMSCSRKWREVVQPVGRIESGRSSGEFILVAGHFDAWGPGATDNAAGNGLMLELARVLSRHRESLRRDIMFAFWNGHEVAEASGSTWFVDNLWDELVEECIAQFNIDQPGIRGTDRFQVLSTPELRRFAVEVPARALGEEVLYSPLRGKHSDQSFYGVGIPSLLGQTVFPPDRLEEMGGAPLGWWWHNEDDTLDKLEIIPLGRSLRVFASYLASLGGTVSLPFDFSPYPRLIEEELQVLRSLTPKLPAQVKGDLSLLADLAERLKGLLDRVETGPIASRNRCLIGLSRRLIPALFTAGCRYEQDPYGFYDLEFPLPISYPLRRLAQLPATAPVYQLHLVEYLRRRNRLVDFLRETIRFLEDCLG